MFPPSCFSNTISKRRKVRAPAQLAGPSHGTVCSSAQFTGLGDGSFCDCGVSNTRHCCLLLCWLALTDARSGALPIISLFLVPPGGSDICRRVPAPGLASCVFVPCDVFPWCWRRALDSRKALCLSLLMTTLFGSSVASARQTHAPLLVGIYTQCQFILLRVPEPVLASCVDFISS